MQAQAVRQEQNQDVLTAAQSLQSIQTLLRAGLGCITYLRNLLPADNFSESYLTSAALEPQPSTPSIHASFSSDSSRRNVSGFKIMTVTRGFTEEADKLLDYLEHGIFDALQKQYLRSFIFAIYLDSQDPNNIVEAYTFNFHYYTVPGSNVSIPVMSLDDDLMKLSISGKKKGIDPVADATKRGKLPTLGEVKRSLKTLIKNLIQATTQMDALPRRRFATFKLFYHDHTPDDYEPPYFRAGDSNKDKWFFSTHDKNEIPEKCSIGQVQTGWHGVDLRVASVSGYLPSAEDNNAPFMGTTAGGGNGLAPPPLTPAEEADLRKQQAEAQKQDALERRVLWDAEEGLGDVDAEGEVDDGDDSQLMGVWRMSSSGLEFVTPMGLRDDDGKIIPLPLGEGDTEPNGLTQTDAALFKGMEEKVPRHVGQLDLPTTNSGDLTQTQLVGETQREALPSSLPPQSSSPPSSPELPTPKTRRMCTRSQSTVYTSLPSSDPLGFSVPSNASFDENETVGTQMLQKRIMAQRCADEDTEMLDTNTQVQDYVPSEDEDTIQSFSASHKSTTIVPDSQPDVQIDNAEEEKLECECGVDKEDSDCVLCYTCNRWFHTWCMGYHSGNSRNLPNQFMCFDCRVHADQNWDLINVHGLHPRMMAKFRDLALFRRAIKIYETAKLENLSAFMKVIGCEPIVCGQLFKRLENEGFITLDGVEPPAEEPANQSRSYKGKAVKKAPPRRRTMQKPRYVFVRKIMKEHKYKDYFDPDPEVEKKLLGLEDLKPKKRAHHKIVTDEDGDMDGASLVPSLSQEVPLPSSVEIPTASPASQTQEESQLILDTQAQPNDLLKRHATRLSEEEDLEKDEDGRKKKRVKISLGPAVDLGD